MGEKETGLATERVLPEAGHAQAETGGGGASERTSNLNLSKSNINRVADSGTEDAATRSTVKSSKSNSSE